MDKISLITLHSVQNYGSALQAYATSVYLSRLGYEVEIVDYVRKNNLKENISKNYLLHSEGWNKNTVTRFAFHFLKERDLIKRYDIFDEFIHSYIKLTPYRYICEEDFKAHPICADIYCSGSDQIWNTCWNRGFVLPYYLSYAEKGARKIAFSSSFGKTVLDENEKGQTRKLLSEYESITVREQSAKKLLSELGIAAERVLDPTLMIEKEEWLRHTTDSDKNGKYILVYQLSHNRDFDKYVMHLARKRKLKLLRIGFGKDAYLYGGKVIMNPRVFEFLSLIANAGCVVTDSFHAVSFALNLNVDFMIWLPKSFESRITDFLKIFGLSDRVFDSFEKLEKLCHKPIDFETVEPILEYERRRSADIIMRMLRGC